MLRTINRFLRNTSGSMATFWVFAMIPVLGGVALSVDYANMSRLRHDLSNATDATCSVVGRSFMAGKAREDIVTEADEFFDENFDAQYLQYADIDLTLPDDEGNTLKQLICKGELEYHPFFGPMMAALMHGNENDYVTILREAKMKMKNVAEIALVLDNSGSMAWDKTGKTTSDDNKRRITLLKTAANKLVTDMITLGQKIHQVSNPVKFSVVPFAASVNVGANNRTASWMDTQGISPIHHENLDWGPALDATNPTGFWQYGANNRRLNASGQALTRFTIYDALKFKNGGSVNSTSCAVWRPGTTGATPNYTNCAVFNRTGTTDVSVTSSAAATAMGTTVADLEDKYKWRGCVEARPDGLDITDETPTAGDGKSLFVPMFAPDEFNMSQYGRNNTTGGTSVQIRDSAKGSYNNWWPDFEGMTYLAAGNAWVVPNNPLQVTATNEGSNTWRTNTSRPRNTGVAKYFANKPYLSASGDSTTKRGAAHWKYFSYVYDNGDSYYDNRVYANIGPNQGCTTNAITPLSGTASTVTAAINAMEPSGGTNVIEGLAWGWRTISSGEPFTEGSPESRKDIDKVIIALTDGANTYYTPDSLGGRDYEGNKSTYASHAYTGFGGNTGTNFTATATSATNKPRLMREATDYSTHSNDNFTVAMNEKMQALCDNVKDENIILMTVALDLDPANYSDQDDKDKVEAQLQNMEDCAGLSKTRKEDDGTPKKLFWNATSDNLDETFKEIADELSNLRFTQ